MSFHKEGGIVVFGCLVVLAVTQVSAVGQTNEVVQLPSITIVAKEPASAASSATVLWGNQIQNGKIESVRELNSVAPNVTLFDANNNRVPKFSVRGLRENNFSAGEPAVGMYVDDVPYADLNSRGLPLYDIEQVEFLRGPQGTLYGAGAAGGLISIATRQPDNDWRGFAGTSYGNYESQDYQAGASGPLVKDKFFFGLAGTYATRDGFVRNNALGTHPDDHETLAGRAQLRWTPTDAWDISLGINAGQDNDGFVPTFYPATDNNAFSVSRDTDGYVDTKSFGQSLRVKHENENFKLTSVTAHRDWKQDLLQDFDFSASPGVLGFSQTKLDQWSQEIRVQSPDSAEKLRWLAGFYFTDKQLKTGSGSIFPVGIPIPFPPFFIPGPLTDETTAKFDDQSYALFGQATFTLQEKLDLTAGLRLERDDRRMARTRVDGTGLFGGPTPSVMNVDDSFDAVLPKVGAAYHFTEEHSVFFNAAAGFQSGGFNASNNDPASAKYDPSRSWNLELGLDSSWCDKRLFTRLALFYSHFTDYQVFRFNRSNPTLAFLANADRAHAFGAELEMEAHPAKNLQISIAVGATEAKFDKFNDAVNGQNFDDKHINFVPQFTATFAVEYRLPCGFFARGEVRGVGEYYLDEANSARQGTFALLNAQAGWKWRNVEAYFFGKNLLDERYYNNALDFRSASQPDLLVLQPGDPITFGGAVTVRF